MFSLMLACDWVTYCLFGAHAMLEGPLRRLSLLVLTLCIACNFSGESQAAAGVNDNTFGH